MSKINQTDLVLKELFDRRSNNGIMPVLATFAANKQVLTMEELVQIIEILERTRFAVFQALPKDLDFNGSITQAGIDFVLTNSFSKPGTSILKL